eukprot:1161362-Pelagomonas_calceolata.AAC.4
MKKILVLPALCQESVDGRMVAAKLNVSAKPILLVPTYWPLGNLKFCPIPTLFPLWKLQLPSRPTLLPAAKKNQIGTARGLLGGVCWAQGSGEQEQESLGVREHGIDFSILCAALSASSQAVSFRSFKETRILLCSTKTPHPAERHNVSCRITKNSQQMPSVGMPLVHGNRQHILYYSQSLQIPKCERPSWLT